MLPESTITSIYSSNTLIIKKELAYLTDEGNWSGKYIVKKGKLDKATFFESTWEAFKGLLGFQNRTNRYLIEFKTIEFIESVEDLIETKEELELIQFLAKRAGLTETKKKEHDELNSVVNSLIKKINLNTENNQTDRRPFERTTKYFNNHEKELRPYIKEINFRKIQLTETFAKNIPLKTTLKTNNPVIENRKKSQKEDSKEDTKDSSKNNNFSAFQEEKHQQNEPSQKNSKHEEQLNPLSTPQTANIEKTTSKKQKEISFASKLIIPEPKQQISLSSLEIPNIEPNAPTEDSSLLKKIGLFAVSTFAIIGAVYAGSQYMASTPVPPSSNLGEHFFEQLPSHPRHSQTYVPPTEFSEQQISIIEQQIPIIQNEYINPHLAQQPLSGFNSSFVPEEKIENQAPNITYVLPTESSEQQLPSQNEDITSVLHEPLSEPDLGTEPDTRIIENQAPLTEVPSTESSEQQIPIQEENMESPENVVTHKNTPSSQDGNFNQNIVMATVVSAVILLATPIFFAYKWATGGTDIHVISDQPEENEDLQNKRDLAETIQDPSSGGNGHEIPVKPTDTLNEQSETPDQSKSLKDPLVPEIPSKTTQTKVESESPKARVESLVEPEPNVKPPETSVPPNTQYIPPETSSQNPRTTSRVSARVAQMNSGLNKNFEAPKPTSEIPKNSSPVKKSEKIQKPLTIKEKFNFFFKEEVDKKNIFTPLDKITSINDNDFKAFVEAFLTVDDPNARMWKIKEIIIKRIDVFFPIIWKENQTWAKKFKEKTLESLKEQAPADEKEKEFYDRAYSDYKQHFDTIASTNDVKLKLEKATSQKLSDEESWKGEKLGLFAQQIDSNCIELPFDRIVSLNEETFKSLISNYILDASLDNAKQNLRLIRFSSMLFMIDPKLADSFQFHVLELNSFKERKQLFNSLKKINAFVKGIDSRKFILPVDTITSLAEDEFDILVKSILTVPASGKLNQRKDILNNRINYFFSIMLKYQNTSGKTTDWATKFESRALELIDQEILNGNKIFSGNFAKDYKSFFKSLRTTVKTDSRISMEDSLLNNKVFKDNSSIVPNWVNYKQHLTKINELPDVILNRIFKPFADVNGVGAAQGCEPLIAETLKGIPKEVFEDLIYTNNFLNTATNTFMKSALAKAITVEQFKIMADAIQYDPSGNSELLTAFTIILTHTPDDNSQDLESKLKIAAETGIASLAFDLNVKAKGLKDLNKEKAILKPYKAKRIEYLQKSVLNEIRHNFVSNCMRIAFEHREILIQIKIIEEIQGWFSSEKLAKFLTNLESSLNKKQYDMMFSYLNNEGVEDIKQIENFCNNFVNETKEIIDELNKTNTGITNLAKQIYNIKKLSNDEKLISDINKEKEKLLQQKDELTLKFAIIIEKLNISDKVMNAIQNMTSMISNIGKEFTDKEITDLEWQNEMTAFSQHKELFKYREFGNNFLIPFEPLNNHLQRLIAEMKNLNNSAVNAKEIELFKDQADEQGDIVDKLHNLTQKLKVEMKMPELPASTTEKPKDLKTKYITR
jgi:hypothetical protein